MLFTSVFGNVSLNAYADDAPAREVIASFTATADNTPAESPVGFSEVGLTLNGANYKGFSAGHISADNIQPGVSYWEFNINASEYESIGLSISNRVTQTGPRDFVFEYALDGSEEFAPLKYVSANLPEKAKNVTETFTLDPSETSVLSGHSFKLRLRVTEDSLSARGDNIAGGGTMGINNIVFDGVKTGGEIVPPTPVCSDVYVVDGVTTVKAGESVSLACDTEGAVIYYNANGTDNFSVYEAPIVINEDTVIKAFAQAEGYADSAVSSFAIKVEAEVIDISGNEQEEVVLPFKDGDVVAIVVSDTALNATVVADKYLGGSPVTRDGDTVVLPSDAAAHKVIVTEDGVAFLNVDNNKYLASTEKGNTLFYQDELNSGALWILEKEEGGWLVKVAASKDAARPQYIEWYSSKQDFTTYGYNEKYKNDYLVNFYPATGVGPIDPIDPIDDTLPFKNGDTVAIVVSDTALNTTVVSEKYLGGTPVTRDGDTVVLPSDAAALKVVVTEDGVAFLDAENNKYLATTEKGNTLFFQDELNSGALWILEETEGGWLVKSVASKDAAKPQYIEWYSSKEDFTTYGYNEKYKSAYVANFYQIATVVPDDTLPFKNGDTVAIVIADTAVTAKVKSTKYLDGSAVTKDGDKVVLPSDAAVHKAIVSEEGVAFLDVDTNKYLATTAAGNTIFYQDELNAGALWILEKEEGGWLVKSAASKDAAKPQYIEWNSKYSDFTTYGYNEKYKSDYLANFYYVDTTYKVDTDTVLKVAQWGGGGPYDNNQRLVYADLIESNDFLDTAKEFVAVVNGAAIAPFSSGTSQSGSTNYYMGGTGIGSGSDDYMQFKLSSFR